MREDTTLRDVQLFAGCRPTDTKLIRRLSTVLDLSPGSEICREGEAAREFVVVLDGQVAATNGVGPVLCGPGSHFGEMGLIDGGRQQESVVALTPVRLLVLDARAFRGMLERVPSVSRKLLRGLVDRVRGYEAPRSLRVVS